MIFCVKRIVETSKAASKCCFWGQKSLKSHHFCTFLSQRIDNRNDIDLATCFRYACDINAI